jgi:predicted metal-dependent hydrolase
MQLSLPFASILEDSPRIPEDPFRTLEDPHRTLEDPHRILRLESPRTLEPEAPPALEGPSTAMVFVRHPGARRYVIRVRADGTVRVTIPRGGSKREARAFAERQQRWIDKQRSRAAIEYAVQPDACGEEAERAVRETAKHELSRRLLELAREHDLEVARVSVRNQRWRWGSCSPNGHICLNWRLIQMPATIRDYVMIHELMHLKRMDHSPKFWKLVARAYPEYKSARRWLREYARH